MAITGWRRWWACAALLMVVGCCGCSNSEPAGLTALKASLNGFDAVLKTHHEKEVSVLTEHTDMLREIRDKIDGLQSSADTVIADLEPEKSKAVPAESPVIDPPKIETVAKTSVPPVKIVRSPAPLPQVTHVENDFIHFVLDNYKGSAWHHNQQPVGVAHLIDHGFNREDMEFLSQSQRGRLHGAIHNNSMSQLRAAYNGSGVVRSNGPVRSATPAKVVTRSTIINQPSRTRSYSNNVSRGWFGNSFRVNKSRSRRRCKNGRCW